MTDAPYGLALGAGLLAAVNPCGFALLPAYLSMLVLGDGPADRRGPLGRRRARGGLKRLLRPGLERVGGRVAGKLPGGF
ncbi:hypothetical protein AB0I76_12585, partial [Micromonospora sp. NPDC049799]